MLDLIDGDGTMLEEPRERLIERGKLASFVHNSYWQSMDSLRDRHLLEEQWRKGARWKVWGWGAAMILVDGPLARREAEGRPIRVALVGAGFQDAVIARQVVTAMPGMSVAGVANRHPEPARRALADLGIEPAACERRATIGAGRPVATEDAPSLALADRVDVVVEVTRLVEDAAGVVLAAIEAGRHVVQMNAELDGTVEPIPRARADAAGVVHSHSDGDRPGVQMNLLRFVHGLGVTPVLCGNIRELQDPYRNPETQPGFAET